MTFNSKIEWTDHTFNPWWGCTKVSPGCTNCYADALDRRTGGAHWGPKADRRRTGPANWNQPRKWNRQAEQQGRRFRVFCASMADVFDDHPSILPEWRDDLWRLIDETPHLDWLLLTKRPLAIMWLCPQSWLNGFPPNVWVGTSVVNQQEADANIPHLLRVPAAVRFLSMEPLLGPVDLTELPSVSGIGRYLDCLSSAASAGSDVPFSIDWVIVGGESGPSARIWLGLEDAVRSLRDQCVAAGVAFHLKQWGEWVPVHQIIGVTGISAAPPAPGHWAHPHRYRVHGGALDGHCFESLPGRHDIMRVGKKAAGRLLDGCKWDQFPQVGAA